MQRRKLIAEKYIRQTMYIKAPNDQAKRLLYMIQSYYDSLFCPISLCILSPSCVASFVWLAATSVDSFASFYP